ncbi:hypothetical protein ABBQ38_015262 [Trebouxia sp. C0009 RCD-2024]
MTAFAGVLSCHVCIGSIQLRQTSSFAPVRRPLLRKASICKAVIAPPEQASVRQRDGSSAKTAGQSHSIAPQLSRQTLQRLEGELDAGQSIAALRRFSDNLAKLPKTGWEAKLRPVMIELAYNLESFNPAFTAVMLKIQSSIGHSDYVKRDQALKGLIQPLAGEYGMHNGQAQGKTHRELFSEFYQDLLQEPLEEALAVQPQPPASVLLFQQMMRDITTAGGVGVDPIQQGSYAMGYNLAIEYLADPEKTWMLESVKELDRRVLQPQCRALKEWLFLEIHAEGEAEHAAIGHDAVLSFVPAEHESTLRRAMCDHDRDFSAFYNKLADMLQ